ncbi:unnamed protein product, partial [Musa hybrid cultivar]
GSGRIPAIRPRGRWPAEGISKMYLGILDLWVWALCSQTLLHLLLPFSRKQTSQLEIQGLQLVVTRQHSAAVLTMLKAVSLETFCHFAHGEGDMLQQKKRPYAKIPSGSSGGYFNFYSTPPGIFSSSNHKFMLSLVNSV